MKQKEQSREKKRADVSPTSGLSLLKAVVQTLHTF